MMRSRNYRDLAVITTFEGRFRYLAIGARVGDTTFGGERYLNQRFYNSTEWKRARDVVIVRDNGCDLGIPGREIFSKVYVHHIEPITPNDFQEASPALIDPDNLITVSLRTHNAIHFGDESQLEQDLVERTPNDHIGWQRTT